MTRQEKAVETEKKKESKKSLFKPMFTIGVFCLIGVVGYFWWKDPALFEKIQAKLLAKEEKTDVYQQQLDVMQEQIAALQSELMQTTYKAENPDFSEINKKVDDIQAISVNTIKSKADVETVLGIIGRMDIAESKLNDLSKVTNAGALILTAAMLVKDAGERGGAFVYEAEVLSELATGHHKIAKDVEKINAIAATGVPSVAELQQKFLEAYATKYPEVVEEQEISTGENWKERIYYQLHKIVKIKKVEKDTKELQVEISCKM